MFVYLITNRIDGKQYVGKTEKSVEERWKVHLHNAAARGPYRKWYLYRAIKKHGVENFSISTLASAASTNELNLLERHFILNLGTLAPNGYNMTPGGDGVPSTPEIREKLRAKAIGRPTSDLQKKTTSLMFKGKPKPLAQRTKMAAAWDEKMRRRQAVVARRVNKIENAKLQDFKCPDCDAEFKQVTKGVYGAHRRVCKNWPETKMWEFATMHAEGVYTYKEMAEKIGVYPQTLFNWAKRMRLPPRQSR